MTTWKRRVIDQSGGTSHHLMFHRSGDMHMRCFIRRERDSSKAFRKVCIRRTRHTDRVLIKQGVYDYIGYSGYRY